MGLFGNIDKKEVATKMLSVVDTINDVIADLVFLDQEGDLTIDSDVSKWCKKEIPKFSSKFEKIAILLRHNTSNNSN